MRGVISDLDKKYKIKVKIRYPKSLEEAIKSAHIFDSILDKNSNTFVAQGNHLHLVFHLLRMENLI